MSDFAGDWASGLSIPVTGSYLGSAQTLCTLNPTSGSANPVSCQHWVDSGTTVTLSGNVSGAAAGTQWVAQGTNSFTDSTGGQTYNVDYLYQIVNVTVTVTVTVTLTGTGNNQSAAIVSPNENTKLQNALPYALWHDYASTELTLPRCLLGLGKNIKSHYELLAARGGCGFLRL
jgi:hypothetical protein